MHIDGERRDTDKIRFYIAVDSLDFGKVRMRRAVGVDKSVAAERTVGRNAVRPVIASVSIP